MIRRYIAWRNRHTTDPRHRKMIKGASTITSAKVLRPSGGEQACLR
jgi:predicted ATPase